MLSFLLYSLGLSAAVGDQFVKVDGNHFSLYGKPFKFQGSSQREAAIHLQEPEIESLFRQNKEKGIKVVRIWAFNEEDCGISGCFVSQQNGKVVINNEALKRLDQVLYYADMYNIKLIMVPVNFEQSFGGFQWWVDNFEGKGKPKEHFYSNPTVQNAYKEYLTALVNRKNTKNQRIYKDDPTIMSWDTANEPHATDDTDTSANLSSKFICDMAHYLKYELHVQQMVTSGEEGYKSFGGPFSKSNQQWVDNGLKGVDFATNVQCTALDYSTVHLYPDNWGISPDQFKPFVDKFMQDRAQLAHKFNKPIVVEEFGCCLSPAYQGRRAEMFRYYLDAFHANDVAGQLVWQVFPPDSPLWKVYGDQKHYDFTFDSDQPSFNLLSQEIARLQ